MKNKNVDYSIVYWDEQADKITRALSLFGYIIANQTGQQLSTRIKHNKAHADDSLETKYSFFQNYLSADKIYAKFQSQLNSLASPFDAAMEYGDEGIEEDFFAEAKLIQVNAAFAKAFSIIHARYKPVIQRHPDKKLNQLIDINFLDYWRAPAKIKKLVKNYSSLEQYVLDNYDGRALIAHALDLPGYNFIDDPKTTELLFDKFPEELKKLCDRPDVNKENFSALDLSDCIDKLITRVFQKNKQTILGAPDRTLNEIRRLKQIGGRAN